MPETRAAAVAPLARTAFALDAGLIYVNHAAVGVLPIGSAHWQSPIAVDGRVAAAEGNANDHATSGVLDVYRLPR